MTDRTAALAEELSLDPGIVAGLHALGLDHDTVRPLADAYVQFLRHAAKGGLEPGIAVRAFWKAHRDAPSFPAFAAAHPELAPAPLAQTFETLDPVGYGRLYAAVALEEPHVDEALWPASRPPRKLGLTNREARWLYLLVLVVSAWIIYGVQAGSVPRSLLLTLPLFALYALARFWKGRAVEHHVALSPLRYRMALSEARGAWPLASYESGARRTRHLVRGRFRLRSA